MNETLSSSDRSPAYSWRSHYTLFLLLLVYTMSFVDRQILGILIEPIKREFKVSDTAMGLLAGLTFALFYSTLAIPFSRYADRANRRNFVSYCCAVWSAMTALCGLAGGYWTLAIARVGVAVGEAGGTAPSLSMVADHYPPERRGRAMSVFMLGPQLGILFGLTLCGWIAHNYGWRIAFISMGIPGILFALLLRFTGVEPLRGRWESNNTDNNPQEPIGHVFRYLIASKLFMRVSLAGLMMGFAGYGIGIWTPAFLVRTHGMSLQGAGAVMGLLGGTMAAIGTLLSGWLCDSLAKRDERWRLGIPALGCLLSLPTGLGFYMMPAGEVLMLGDFAIPKAVGLYMLFGVTAVWWIAPVFAMLSELTAAHQRATAMAIFTLGLTMVGAGLGPLVVGLVSDALMPAFGNDALRFALAGITAICYVVSLLIFLTTIRSHQSIKEITIC
jgi:MFS family permease